MKHMVFFFLALTAVLAATTNAVIPVLDINGNPIFSGSYYVLPVIRQGGGLALTSDGNKPCPLNVVQVPSYDALGLPVKFSNWKPKVAFVPESTSLNIEMDFSLTICSHPTYWVIEDFDQEIRLKWFVAAGAIPEEHGQDSFKSFFQIRKVEDFDAYEFVFCPKNCIDVGIFVDQNGDRRLALSSEPFLVQFMNADEAATMDSSKAMTM